nr:hypothetical protein [Tanacetum cinerariifolium]
MHVTRQGMTPGAIEKLVAKRVADALLTYDANQNIGNANENGNENGNGDGSHDSRIENTRPMHTTRGCTQRFVKDSGGLSSNLASSFDHSNDPILSFHITFAMLTQRDIYAAGSKNRPHMLNKENYVPCPSRLLRYGKSRPIGKLIYNSIINGPYVRQMIPEPGDAARTVPVPETFHKQTDDELMEAEIKHEGTSNLTHLERFESVEV